MTERISVIIPVHNEEEYIGQCLECVRAAERKLPTPVEVVVVLNRCTDRKTKQGQPNNGQNRTVVPRERGTTSG